MDGYFTTERHQHLRNEVRAFAETTVRPLIPDMEASKAVQHDLSRLIARQGWVGVTISPDYGGMGLGHLAKTIIIEELSRVSAAMGAMVQASQLGVAKILHYGSDTQKKTWLPAVADGSCLPTIAVTESQSGGHVLGMTATAVRDGDDYILNGRKVFVGNSHVGDLHGVVVRTGAGSRGLSAFLVESERPGFSLGPHRAAMGLHGFSFGELIFDNCRVPAANLLGTEGDGLAVAYSSSLLYGRANLTAVSLGIHQALMEETSAFVTERHRYGGPLHDLLPIKLKVGQMQSRLMNVGCTRIGRWNGTCATRTISSHRPEPPTCSCFGWARWRWACRRGNGHTGWPPPCRRRRPDPAYRRCASRRLIRSTRSAAIALMVCSPSRPHWCC